MDGSLDSPTRSDRKRPDQGTTSSVNWRKAVTGATLFIWVLGLAAADEPSNLFTVHLASPAAPPVPLVQHQDSWRYHKGTNAPSPEWKTLPDAALDTGWATGTGGFGYGDNDDRTLLGDMFNGYSTIYIRRTFVVASPLETNLHLRLVMDWDDGFVAWLDGVEVARSLVSPVGIEPPHTAVADQEHEASGGQNGSQPQTYDLGIVGERLGSGPHVLAIMGLNVGLISTDFSLIADLFLEGSDEPLSTDGRYFALCPTPEVILSGSNLLDQSTRVTVNGQPAEFNLLTGTWSRTHSLQPGMNRLFIAALDSQGHVLASSSNDVVAAGMIIPVGGVITNNLTWEGPDRSFLLTNNILVAPGVTLTIRPGTVVLMPPSLSIVAGCDAVFSAVGSSDQPIFFLPAEGAALGLRLGAEGSGATAILRHVETVGGQITAARGATLTVEDSLLREGFVNEVVTSVDAAALTMRRTHIKKGYTVCSRATPLLFEDCLFEQSGLESISIENGDAPSIIRRCTIRHRRADDIGLGGRISGIGVWNEEPGLGLLLESCLIHGFSALGLRIGPHASGTTVAHSLIYDCALGIHFDLSRECQLLNDTITRCGGAMTRFAFEPGAILFHSTNSVIWGNGFFEMEGGEFAYSDVQGGVPGPGNINLDPLFIDSINADFRLGAGSPALGTGANAADMGASWPWGGLPPAPFVLAAILQETNSVQLEWQEDADNEERFLIERSRDATSWEQLGAVAPNETVFTDHSALPRTLYFYRVRAENRSGSSPWSNVASAVVQSPLTPIGGVLTRSITFSPSLGTLVVVSNVMVPTNLSLTLLPGAIVLMTNGSSILAAAGGAIDVFGEADHPVIIASLEPGVLWRELSAQGPNASITLRHADISGGQTTVYSNAFGLFEDSFFHDYRTTVGAPFVPPILLSSFAGLMEVRRCHFREYYETLFRDGVITIEDSLFEYMSGDALDFDGAQPGTVLRRCTFRHGIRAPSNIDAIDIGPGQSGGCRGVVVEDCLIFDFPTDKGVSIGDAPNPALGTIVRNCLIRDCFSGIQVKDDILAEVYQCTLVNNRWGFTNYNKSLLSALPGGGGHTTNAHNNILWNNGLTVSMWHLGTLTADHCNLGDTNWPGAGNLNIDPLFVDSAAQNYQLRADSPCRGTGRDGTDMGAHFPVGAVMAPSHPTLHVVSSSDSEIRLQFWADSESCYLLQSTSDPAWPDWNDEIDIAAPARPRQVQIGVALFPDQTRFYRLLSHKPEPAAE